MSDARLDVRKTYKLLINGAFPRSESGRSYEVAAANGEFLANVAQGSRKDLRDAVVAAVRGHDAVVHVAALVGPRLERQLAYDVNVNGTRNVMAAARDGGRLVHISSPSVAFAGVAAVAEPVRPAT